MVGFTTRQIDSTKLARKIYSNVWIPTVMNFKQMVFTSMISDFPITVEDIRNAEKLYGPLMESLKGKAGNEG